MKKIIIGLVFLYSAVLNAQENITPYPMEESSLLWSIEGNGIKKGSYVFGTMHLIEKEFFVFPKKLEKIASKSELIALELSELPSESEVMKYIVLENGTFFDFFTPEQTDSIFAWAYDKMKMTESTFRSSFSQFKPFVILQLAIQMEFIGKTESYEMSIMELAKKNNIKLFGLETIEEQMSLFDSLTDNQQAEMVMESVRGTKDEVAESKHLMEVYQSQEIDSLYMLIIEQDGVISDEQNSFLDERNKKWIPLIIEQLNKQPTFIAVGAGHLGGPKGIIRLLEKEGYKLSPVKL
jgi:uncharacterized protein YbaP (TraB family)